MAYESGELTAEQVTCYREVLLTHGSVHGTSMCHICGVARCPDWVDAYDKLAAANVQMVRCVVLDYHALRGVARDELTLF